jgi:hypothetical protein
VYHPVSARKDQLSCQQLARSPGAPGPESPAVAIGFDSNGTRTFAVPSRSGSAAAGSTVYHLVRQEECRLRCNCLAGAYGRSCRHTAAVTAHILRETQARLDRADAARTPPPGEHAAPHRDSRAFSMWK